MLLFLQSVIALGKITCGLSAFLTVRRCQPDADPAFVNLEPQAAVLVIVGLLAQFRVFACKLL